MAPMNHFTIKDIENLSGIKAHTWRIWEQRYGLGMPQRKDSNHRFYNNESLKQILRISYLYNSGLKISKIASLDNEDLKNKALSNVLSENDHEYYVKELIEASIDLDEERFENTFVTAIQRMGLESTFVKILCPFQEKIGMLWLTDHVIPAQEHFTSNIIRQKLSVAIDELPLPTEGDKRVLLFTPEKEQHEIPLQFIHYNLRKNRNRVVSFGCNIKLLDLKSYAEGQSFTHVFFHLVTNLTNLNPDDYLENLSKAFPDKQIMMSGSQAQQVSKLPNNVRLIKSIEDLLKFVKE
jgi:DNA-binding transcriptional MerR regulator